MAKFSLIIYFSSYDEDEDEYESNIDILESQLDDCMSNMINEW